MTIKDWIKKKILSFLGLEQLSESPNDKRLTYISNDDDLKIEEVRANRVWYSGSGDELLNFYTERDAGGFAENPIYNRNKRNYFWSQSAQECKIKRVHSGVPNAIVTTLSNVIGMPQISVEGYDNQWEEIANENNLTTKLTQQIRPLTMALGWGGVKLNFNKNISDYPLFEFYDAEYVEYVVKQGVLVGMIFKSFYKDNHNKDYVLLETRYKAKGNSYIEYALFELKKGNVIETADLHCIPELNDLPTEPIVVEGLNEILAVPYRYFYDPNNPKYGKSIYAGKLDLFDMLDEIWSQASQTNRVSTPITWYSPDVVSRGANGQIGVPNLYNRQLVMKDGIPNGEGVVNQDIVVDQPQLNFDKYGLLARDVLDYIYTGVISSATMGQDVSKKDNADAQREKEKITIMTRNNIIAGETPSNKKLVKLALVLKEYMDTGLITKQDYNINVQYNEFANPSLENTIPVLGGAWSQGQISTEKYVDMLWGDKLTDEEKLKEIQWLDENKQKDEDFDIDALGENDERTINEPLDEYDISGEARGQENAERFTR